MYKYEVKALRNLTLIKKEITNKINTTCKIR